MKAVINVEKFKTNQQIKDVSDHNLRQTTAKNVDSSRSKDNTFYIGNTDTDTIFEMETRLQKVGKFRKDANRLINIVFSASHEFFENATKEKIKEWEEATFKYACETFGKENIIYAVVHNDERTPHFHFCFTPILDNKLKSNHWFDGPAKIAKLHTDYAKAVKSFGIKRGVKFEKSTQEDIARYTEKVNASAKYEDNLDNKLEKLAQQFENPTLKQKLNPWAFYREVVKPFCGQLINNLSHYRTKEKRYAKLKKENKDLKSEVENLHQKIETLELKFENLGISPNISFAHIPKIKDYIAGLASPKDVPVPPPPSGDALPGHHHKPGPGERPRPGL